MFDNNYRELYSGAKKTVLIAQADERALHFHRSDTSTLGDRIDFYNGVEVSIWSITKVQLNTL